MKMKKARTPLGQALKTLRDRHGMNQVELAWACQVKRPTINMVESGLREPSIELLRRFCRVFNGPMENALLLFGATETNLLLSRPLKPLHLQAAADVPNTHLDALRLLVLVEDICCFSLSAEACTALLRNYSIAMKGEAET